MARKRKPRVVRIEGIPVTPITRRERKAINKSIKRKYERLRKRYPELHGKTVDFVNHFIEGGTLYLSVRFTDKTDFSIRYDCKMFVVGADLSDAKTGDYDLLREYMRPILS